VSQAQAAQQRLQHATEAFVLFGLPPLSFVANNENLQQASAH
jgi:hypothetical protein